MIANDGSHSLITIAFGLVTVAAVMGFTMWVAVRKEKLTVVDTAWGLGFILVAFVSLFVTGYGDGMPQPQIFLFALVLVWGLRLAFHLNAATPRPARTLATSSSPRPTDARSPRSPCDACSSRRASPCGSSPCP